MKDLIIIGAGAAGYTAGIYSSRYQMDNIILSKDDGGMGATAVDVENYPGFISIKGPELMGKFREHAEHYGSTVQIGTEVKTIEKIGEAHFKVTTDKEEVEGKAVLIVCGSKRRKLGVETEDEYYGKGVSYCATCDGFFFREKTVAIVGGGDSAMTAALHMSNISATVYLVYRGPEEKMRAEPFWIAKAKDQDNIEFVTNAVPEKFSGEPTLQTIHMEDGRELSVDGCFIEVGATPSTDWLEGTVELNDKGFVKIDKTGQTNVSGIYAAGDATDGSNHFEQFVTANSEAAIAVNSIFNYIKANS